MQSKNRFVLILTILLATIAVYAQPVDMKKIEYKKEVSAGLNINTNGGLLAGVDFRYSVKQMEGKYITYGVSLIHVKHTKEIRTVGLGGQSFIFGKMNYLFSLRPQIGYEKLLFNKSPDDGIQVNLVISGGPSLGLVKPYFVEFADPQDTIYNPQRVPYTSELSYSGIVGPGGFFYGLNMIKVVPGINAKLALNFEFDQYRSTTKGVEAGFTFEWYSQIIKFNQTVDSRPLFYAVFVSLYFGSRYQ